jgi:hypothetical protein
VAEITRDTIYVDIDDEITGIIDKVRASDGKIIALVLPKRASVFQSVVNMKLLKRATEQAKKHIVLITAEAGLLPLAGAVGVHVAASLTDKPEIPAAPLADDGREEMVEESASLDDDDPDEVTSATAGATPIGELAGLGAAAVIGADGVETVEMPDDKLADAAAAEEPKATGKGKKPSKADKKAQKKSGLKVPNFERFRLLIILGALLLIILIVGGILAFSVLPKASISIQTDASNINTSVNLTLDTTATSLNTQTNTVPAKQVQQSKTYTATANATGQQNNGVEATGSVTMSAGACSANIPSDIPAGTGVTANNQTYITQNDTTFIPVESKGHCTFEASNATNITAQSPGAAYNTSGTVTFTVANNSGVTASGSASGGTDNIQTIVEQSDIASAEGQINTTNSTIKSTLEQQLQQDNLYAIPATYSASTPTPTPSTAAGSPASSVTVTETVIYTMYGTPQSDLTTLLNNNIKSQVNTSEQSILDTGISKASFTTTGSANTNLTMTTTAVVGPSINVANIKKQAVGLKSGQVQSAIKSDPNVTGVTVHLSPFWVTTVPKNANKITVKVAKPTGTASNGSNT